MTREVLLAFLLPLAMFIAALAGFGCLLRYVVAAPYQTPLALVLAVAVTVALMLIGRRVARPPRKE